MSSGPSLVTAGLAERLERACRTAVGDSLRSITYFTPADYEQVYLRSDLEADADLAGFVEHEANGFHARVAYSGTELGDYRYTVRAFENGYVTRVVTGEAGAFVTTDGLTLHRAEEVAAALGGVLE